MGNRFITERHLREGYSAQRISRRLNEGDFEPHHLQPYGIEGGKFSYRQMFQENQSRQGNRQKHRAPKKSARQSARHQLKYADDLT
ncbi:hypothetical protein KDA_25500 [Dictyobacter alpinus]|uniref:Uncharacterized protein n=1 Tax=Dictyobacter alpinus TaxID=2014873 RepID=A0A402B6U9_9CHLR|nr:hypothetical protein [Dictyobacter alpinus]GCE27066.1 hypothetical protein KDA_25500 [Dictyobacter alpinus]